jgi:hypothetical protein
MYTPPTGIGQLFHLFFSGASHAARFYRRMRYGI